MLVITREPGQSITIGPDIIVTIGRIRGQSVRLCIVAPPNIGIVRKDGPPPVKFRQKIFNVPDVPSEAVPDAE